MIELLFQRIFLAIRRRSVEISKIVEATGNGNGKQLSPILIDIIHYNTLFV
jgi:hypothetical protein